MIKEATKPSAGIPQGQLRRRAVKTVRGDTWSGMNKAANIGDATTDSSSDNEHNMSSCGETDSEAEEGLILKWATLKPLLYTLFSFFCSCFSYIVDWHLPAAVFFNLIFSELRGPCL